MSTNTLPKTRRLRRFLTAASATALASSLVACGGAAPAGNAPAATPGALTTVKIEVTPFSFEGVELAQRHDIFTKHGLKVESAFGAGSSDKQLPKVVNGELDMVMAAGPTVIKAVEKGIPVTITSGVTASGTSESLTDGLLVAPNSPVTGFKDLAGKTVGTVALGNLPQLVTSIALKQNGVDPASVKFVTLPNDALPEAALKGQVDAVLPTSVVYAKAVSDGFKPIGQGSREFFPGAPLIVFIASKKFVEQNPETVKKFNAAMDEANELAAKNPDEVRAIDKELTKLPPTFIETRELEKLSTAVDRDVMEKFTAVMHEFNLTAKKVPADSLVWPEAPTP